MLKIGSDVGKNLNSYKVRGLAVCAREKNLHADIVLFSRYPAVHGYIYIYSGALRGKRFKLEFLLHKRTGSVLKTAEGDERHKNHSERALYKGVTQLSPSPSDHFSLFLTSLCLKRSF